MLLDGAQLNRMTRACEVCEEPCAHRTPRPGEGQRARGTGPQKTPPRWAGPRLPLPAPRRRGAREQRGWCGPVRRPGQPRLRPCSQKLAGVLNLVF